MATHKGGKNGERPFPALVIVFVLLLLCLFPGQRLIGGLFPGIAGQASLDPTLVILDIPVQSPVAIDLVLVPTLFLLIYTIVLLIFPAGRRQVLPRLVAILAGVCIIAICIAVGALISYLVHDHLPDQIRNSMGTLGINTDLLLPNKTLHLHGDVILLLGMIIGMAIAIGRINKPPKAKKTSPLTREQRMTPYERMLQERARPATKPQDSTHLPYQPKPRENPESTTPTAYRPKQSKPAPVHTFCHNQPLFTLLPEAVNYMPLR